MKKLTFTELGFLFGGCENHGLAGCDVVRGGPMTQGPAAKYINKKTGEAMFVAPDGCKIANYWGTPVHKSAVRNLTCDLINGSQYELAKN